MMTVLYMKIFELLHHIEIRYRSLSEETGLRVAEIHVLRALFTEDGQKASVLAAQVGRAATSFTPLLDRLESKGFIARTSHPTDRRSIIISLTPMGEALRQNITQYAEEVDEQLEAELPNWLPGVGYESIILPIHQDGLLGPTNVKKWMGIES